MKLLSRLMLTLGMFAGLVTGIALAGATDPLFVNLTTDEAHRAGMAIAFGKNQLERGHPLTVFLNDKGVFLGSKAKAGAFGDQQKALEALMAKGAKVIVCPMCMKHYGVTEADLIPGLEVGNPDLTGGALFQDNAKSLTW
jgi:sulfur relay (sulfurtransferase) complex TusBCD TusD component (DsrE family)